MSIFKCIFKVYNFLKDFSILCICFRRIKTEVQHILSFRALFRDLCNKHHNYFKRNNLGVANRARKIRQVATAESDFSERNSVEAVAPWTARPFAFSHLRAGRSSFSSGKTQRSGGNYDFPGEDNPFADFNFAKFKTRERIFRAAADFARAREGEKGRKSIPGRVYFIIFLKGARRCVLMKINLSLRAFAAFSPRGAGGGTAARCKRRWVSSRASLRFGRSLRWDVWERGNQVCASD